MSFWEVDEPAVRRLPVHVYIELRLDKDGTAKGKLSLATPVLSRTGDTSELENYDVQPISLSQGEAATRGDSR